MSGNSMKGYKQAEFGVIPEEWIECRFEDVMTGFSSGQTPYRAVESYYRGDIPWITSGELNYNVITDTIEKITIEGVRAANLKMIPKGTFLFAITGLEAAGTRGSCAITGIDATTNQSCMALYPNKNVLITPYLYHYYIRYGNELAFRYCQGTKQQSYTGGIAKKLPIIVPNTIEEQTAIATALSDADTLITSLEKLIEKKRAIKQGAMQELLKKIEECGFTELGDFCEFTQGIQIPISDQSKDQRNGYIRYLYIRDFFTDEYPCYVEDIYPNKIMNPKDLMMVNTGNTAGKVYSGSYGVLSNNAFKITFNDKIVDRDYLYILLRSTLIQNSIQELFNSSGQPHVGHKNIAMVKIPLPGIEEQTHIATILSDMDAEITALEQKLAKYKQIKQGMMQELLTGRVRLI